MPLPVIADTFRVALNWGTPGTRHAVNVMHFAGVTSTPQDLMDSLDASVTTAMWDWAATGVSIHSVDITPLDGASATQTFSPATPAHWSGGGTGNVIPQAAGIVKFTTDLRGRSYRGRIFIPYVGEGEQDNGNLIDVAAVQTAWSNFKTAMAVETNPMVLASYKLSTAELVTGVFAEGRTGTQRRRNLR